MQVICIKIAFGSRMSGGICAGKMRCAFSGGVFNTRNQPQKESVRAMMKVIRVDKQRSGTDLAVPVVFFAAV